MFSALTDATDRLDPKWLVSYWLPALVATFAGVGVLALLVGPPLLDAWLNELDGVDQIVFGALLLGVTSILALFFKAMRRPILHLFAGDDLPRRVADWAIRREKRAMARAAQVVQTAGEPGTDVALHRWRAMLDRAVPLEPQHVKPTRFGNMFANMVDHTSVVHGMDYFLWWPRLAPLLPDAMRDIATSEMSNMTGLLNLSLVWATAAVVGAAVLGLIGSLWGTAVAVLVSGLLLSWVCYRAAIRECDEAGRFRHAAFHLYRHEILKQMAVEIPGDAETERALWRQLTADIMERLVPVPGAGTTPDGSPTAAAPDGSAATAKGRTHRSKTAASHRAGAG
jgi:hypothetical protein